MNIEALFEKSDFHAIVFQKYLLSTGQISTNTIFSAPAFRNDIAFIKDKVFVFLMKPLLDICNCTFRIDNLHNLNFNFIFTLKEQLLPMINAVNAKLGVSTYNLSNLTPELLKGYRDEIHQYNVNKFMEFFKGGYIIGSEKEFLDDITMKAKSLNPYESHKITLDLFTIARIMMPSWLKYLQSVANEAKEVIKEDVRKNACDAENIIRSITELKLYWDGENNGFVNYHVFSQKVAADVRQPTRGEVSESAVRKMLYTSDEFFLFKVNKREINPPEIKVSLDGSYYQIRRLSSVISITENGSDIRILSPKKTNFLQKHIKTLVLPVREIYTDSSLRMNCGDEQTMVIYLPKANDVFAKAISTKRYKNLKILQELFKFPEFKEQKLLFENAVQSMIASIESFVVNKNLLDFMREFHKKESFIAKIINSFISLWNERSLSSVIDEEQSKIDSISNSAVKLGLGADNQSKTGPSQDYDPVQTVINIIKNDVKAKQIRQILAAKGISKDEKTNQIMNLYDDIGATSRAVIAKNEKLQNDFLSKIKPLVERA